MLLHEQHPTLAEVAVCLARGRPAVRPLVFADSEAKRVDYSAPVCPLSLRQEVFPLQPELVSVSGVGLSRSDLAGFRFGRLAQHGFAAITHEQDAELDTVARALDRAVDLLLAGPLPRTMLDRVAEEIHVTLETFLLEGLRRIAWTPKRLEVVDKLSGDERALLALSYGAGRVWKALRPLHPGGDAGVYVCVGDGHGPGCGLVFTGRRRDEPRLRCVHCSLTNGRAILKGAKNGPSLVQLQPDGTPFWAERFDPACRTVLVWVCCATCETWFSSARPPWLTDDEAARELRVERTHIQDLVSQGTLPGQQRKRLTDDLSGVVNVEGRFQIHVDDLDAYMRATKGQGRRAHSQTRSSQHCPTCKSSKLGAPLAAGEIG